MKFFKKALVASAILAATNVAYAADLTDAVTATSIQGAEKNGVSSSSVRVIVREQLEAGDKITLVFGKGVTGLSSVVYGAAAVPADGVLGIKYGSGTYQMGNDVITTATDGTQTVVLEVLTGDPITKDSSFEVMVFGTSGATSDLVLSKASEATVTYSAVSGLTGAPKDTTGDNVGSLLVMKDQYASSVSKSFNGIIERVNQVTFVKNGETEAGAASTAKDSFAVKFSDNQSLLSAVDFGTGTGVSGSATAKITGDFSKVKAADATIANTGDDTCVAADTSTTVITVTCTGGADKVLEGFTLAFDAPASGTFPVTTFDVTTDVNFTGAKVFNTGTEVAAGEWELDATIINVPYFPVGKEGTSSSIHFANETSSDVDVIVSAIDAAGNVYAAMDLGKDLAKNTVTKVSQTELITLLGLPTDSLTKLSVTFNIDADKGDVNGYAFTTDETGRTEISTSQQRGN